MNKRGVFGLTAIQAFFASILVLAILSFVIIAIFGSLLQNNIIPHVSSSDNNNSIYFSPQTLTSQEGISSSSVSVYNQTLLDTHSINTYIQLLNLSFINISNNHSFSLGFKFTISNNTNYRNIFTMGTADNRNGCYIKFDYLNNRTMLACGNSTTTGTEVVTPTNGLIPGQTYYYVLVHNTTEIKQFINGRLVREYQSYANNSIQNSSTRMRLGNSIDVTTATFNGSFYNFFMFNSSLTDYQASSISQIESQYINYTLNKTLLPQRLVAFDYVNSSLIYASNGTSIIKSTDGGNTYTNLKFLGNSNWSSSIYYSKISHNLLVGLNGIGAILVSTGNDTNFTTIYPFISQNSSMWYASEDSFGNIYLAEYGYGNGSIVKSTDGGINWNLVYNSTFYNWSAKHMHWLGINPINEYIYATQGDVTNSRIIRSIDNGITWSTIRNFSDDDQYTSGVFIGTDLVLGMDRGTNVSIVKMDKDGNNVKYVYTFPSNQTASAVWSMSNYGNKIVAGSVCDGSNNNDTVGLLYSPNGGENWFIVYEILTSSAYSGFNKISNFDNNGYAIFNDEQNNLAYLFNILDNPNRLSNEVIYWGLNENNGTIAYDSSGNGNNGTISGATWQTDGIILTLTDGVDYSLNKVTGVLTMADDYLYSWVMSSWSYYVTGSNTAANNILINVSSGVSGFFSAVNPVYAILAILVIILVLLVLVRVVQSPNKPGEIHL